MRFTVRALGVLASLLTVPAASAGLDSAPVLGCAVPSFARDPVPLPKTAAMTWIASPEQSSALHCRGFSQRQDGFYRKAHAQISYRHVP
jgi:hypothetical protein